MLVSDPASRSAWVTVWVAVQVNDAPGARVAGSTVGAQSTVSASSARVIPVSVWLPVFVRSEERRVGKESGSWLSGSPFMNTGRAGVCSAGTVTVSVTGGVWVESAVATLVSDPASRWAGVMVWVAVHVNAASGARVAGSTVEVQSTVSASSARVIPVSVWLPVFVTT